MPPEGSVAPESEESPPAVPDELESEPLELELSSPVPSEDEPLPASPEVVGDEETAVLLEEPPVLEDEGAGCEAADVPLVVALEAAPVVSVELGGDTTVESADWESVGVAEAVVVGKATRIWTVTPLMTSVMGAVDPSLGPPLATLFIRASRSHPDADGSSGEMDDKDESVMPCDESPEELPESESSLLGSVVSGAVTSTGGGAIAEVGGADREQ